MHANLLVYGELSCIYLLYFIDKIIIEKRIKCSKRRFRTRNIKKKYLKKDLKLNGC